MPFPRASALRAAAAALPLLVLAPRCVRLPDQPHYKVLQLRGSHYEMGLQHGRALCPEIKALYTRFLAASVLPYLNRYRPLLTPLPFPYYTADSSFAGSKFAYALLVESARAQEPLIPLPYRDEMRGIADGCGIPYEQVLVTNTFFDTLLALLSAASFVTSQSSPRLTAVALEPGGPVVAPYETSPFALFTEVPPSAGFRFSLADPAGIDPSSLRVTLDGALYDAASGALAATPTPAGTDLVFRPPAPLSAGSVHRLLLQAGDRLVSSNPPPEHENYMRDERIEFSTEGFGKAPTQITNGDVRNPKQVAASLVLGVRGSATADGGMLVGRNFVLLDDDAAHDFTALFVRHPDGGRAHVALGWAGAVWALTGMNEEGLVACLNPSDTLNNAMAGEVLRNLIAAHLVAPGVPGGILGRMVLEGADDVPQGADLVRPVPKTYGWNLFLASGRSNAMRVLEMDSNVLGSPEGGVFDYDPGDLDPATGRPFASVATDDLAMSTVFLKNREDVDPSDPRLQISIGSIHVQVEPQRVWAGGYFTALTTLEAAASRTSAGYGGWDVPGMIAFLRDPMLTDLWNNMHSAVFDAKRRTVYVAMGGLPANAGPFVPFGPPELQFP